MHFYNFLNVIHLTPGVFLLLSQPNGKGGKELNTVLVAWCKFWPKHKYLACMKFKFHIKIWPVYFLKLAISSFYSKV